MDPLAAHQRAQDVFAGVLAGVGPGQMDDLTPCPEWTVGELIDHVIGGNEKVAIRAGLRSEPPARPDQVAEAHRATAAAAQEVFAAPGGMSALFGLPVGQMTGEDFIRIRTTDALVHAWDLAKATHQSTDLDPELSTQVLAASQHLPDALRGPGKFFGDPQPCDGSRPPADQLAAFLGRSVTWVSGTPSREMGA